MTQTSETAGPTAPALIERTGIEIIPESDRTAHPRNLFWPWFAANVSVFGISYGSFLLGFGISLWQATMVAVVGIAVSFFLCGLIAIADKRGSVPTIRRFHRLLRDLHSPRRADAGGRITVAADACTGSTRESRSAAGHVALSAADRRLRRRRLRQAPPRLSPPTRPRGGSGARDAVQ